VAGGPSEAKPREPLHGLEFSEEFRKKAGGRPAGPLYSGLEYAWDIINRQTSPRAHHLLRPSFSPPGRRSGFAHK
jgi:hypothetical protein